MAKEYELMPGAAKHSFPDGTVVEPGGTTTSEQPLDKLFKGKFRPVGATRAAKPRDHDPTLNESGGRQMDRPEGERQEQAASRPTAGRAARGTKPGTAGKDQGKVAQARVNDFDYPEGEEGKEADTKEREQAKRQNAATGDDAAKTRHPANEVEEEEEETDVEEGEGEEEEEVESQFGEEVTTDFRGAKKAGLQVFHDEDAGTFTVVKADRPTKAIHTEELKTKAAVNRLVGDNK